MPLSILFFLFFTKVGFSLKSVAEVLNPRTLIRCKKNNVQKQQKTERRKENRFNGNFGHKSMRERHRERDSIHTTQFKIIILCNRMFSVSTFIQVHTD